MASTQKAKPSLQEMKATFREQAGFSFARGLNLGASFVRQRLLRGCEDRTRFQGPMFDRVVSKVEVIREYVEAGVLDDCVDLVNELLLIQYVGEEAIARYFIARLLEPRLLEVGDFDDAEELLRQHPWLEARRCHFMGTYKLFTKISATMSAGSYTGVTVDQTMAARMLQHDGNFANAVKNDGRSLPQNWSESQRALYHPGTDVNRILHIAASSMHVSEELLTAMFYWLTGKPWPFPPASIHHITASLDECILCTEFADFRDGMAALCQLPSTKVVPRRFWPLNAQMPRGSPMNVPAAELLQVQSVEDQVDVAAAMRETYARELGKQGLEARLVKKAVGHELVVDLGDECRFKFTVTVPGFTSKTAAARIRTVQAVPRAESRNGHPLAASPTISELLDCYDVIVQVGAKEQPLITSGCILAQGDGDDTREGLEGFLSFAHYLISDYRRWPPRSEPRYEPQDSLLALVAVRLVSTGGCGLRTRFEDRRWSVEMPLPATDQQATVDYYATFEAGEQDVGARWTLPASLRLPRGATAEGQWCFVVRANTANPRHLSYRWERVEDEGAKQFGTWSHLVAPLDPCHRYLVNLARQYKGLVFIGKPMSGPGKRKRYGRDGKVFHLPIGQQVSRTASK
ncbi:unnamed protein product [Jaminaea pallidilutea]